MVRRLVLVLLVVCLGFQAGLLSLACGEPCALTATGHHPDGDCPPLSTTCGCCTMAAAPALLAPPFTAPLASKVAVLLFPPACPRAGRLADIWHIPLA